MGPVERYALPFTVIRFDQTPNPNALKCVVEPSPAESPRAYREAPPAEVDPLAARLFEIEGVSSLLIHAEFITVVKDAGAPWKGMRAAIRRALKDAT